MSLINDALKRASESQAQAATRPRGPKGIEDLPAPMTPVSARERPAWVPVVGIGLVIVALLGASGFFFAKWWKERQAWQPYVETPEDEPATNDVARAKPPPAKPVQLAHKTPPVTTNPPPKTVPSAQITPPPKAITPEPPAPASTNPVFVAKAPPVKQPDPVIPPPAVTPTAPPPVTPPTVPKAETNPPPLVIPPAQPGPPVVPKKGDDHATKIASVEFPELKLQGISRRKNKTFAVLNGKTLSLGDRIDGVILLKIDTDSVIVEKGGARRELFLLR